MKITRKSNLSICAWNIDGAIEVVEGDRYSKLSEPEVQAFLEPHDIICLSETHCSPQDQITIPGYKIPQPLVRPRKKTDKKNYGGMAIAIRETIGSGIKYIGNDHNCPEFIWLKLENDYFKLASDIYLLSVYLPPQNSPVYKEWDLFSL